MRSTRLSLLINAELAERLQVAAAIEHMTVTALVVSAAVDRAEEVLAAQTAVPSGCFDQLLAALDAPDETMPELARLAAQPRRYIRR